LCYAEPAGERDGGATGRLSAIAPAAAKPL
jgi:hypothetical protein